MIPPKEKRLKIAYVSSHDPRDKSAWSGSHYSIYSSALKHIGDVDVTGPYTPSFALFVGKVIHFFSLLTGKRYNYRHSKLAAKAYGKFFSSSLRKKNYDLVIAASASCEIAYLKTIVPIVYIADATFKSSLNYHKSLSRLSAYSEKEGLSVEELALKKSSVLALTSPWAAHSVTDDYGISKRKVITLPFGANFEEVPDDSFAHKRKSDPVCKLLFVGVHWENKGGPIAVNILTRLLEKGINAELTVCV
jgi:hypothetical protein